MENIIKRVHPNEEVKELDTITKSRISEIEKSISEAFEEAKMDETLKPTISQLDFFTLKQIDEITQRHRYGSGTTSTSIRPEKLSNVAVNLYVAMVRRVYIATVRKCSREYTIQELSTVTNGFLSLKQQMTMFSSNDKDKKFYAAEEAMDTLTKVNNEVRKRISIEEKNTKKMILAK